MKKKSYIAGVPCEYSICNAIEIEKIKGELELNESLTDIVEFSKIISDKTRGNIIYLLYKKGWLCVCDLANILDMSSQAISSQLIKLHDKGYIKRKKKGLTVFYSLLNEEFISYLKHIL